MLQRLLACAVLVVLCANVFAAKTTVVLNGKVVTVPMVESGGKAFLDIAALAKLLGWKVTYLPANHKVMINSGAAAAGAAMPSAGGAGAASKGTVQLAGDNGVLGQLYSLRKDRPLYFVLKSAEYTVGQVVVGDRLMAPDKDHKLLVLHFSIQNPAEDEQYVRFDSLSFTAVDAMNVNHEGRGDWGDELSRQPVRISLKPAQKIDCYTAIEVPAKGPIPKLMVLPGENNGPILRYDLRDKVTGLVAPFVDTSDATGASALGVIPAVQNTAYPMADFDLSLEGLAWSSADLLGRGAPRNGSRYLVATVTMTNKNPGEQYLRWDTPTCELLSTDGEELRYQGMLLATADRSVGQSIKAGQSMRVRLVFEVLAGATPATLTISEQQSRSYVFEIGN